MARKARVKYAQFPAGRRVLAISDIHGSLPFFQGVLAAAHYTPEDVLVLVGDLVEKGPDSLGLLRAVMELAGRNRVYCLRGNCDNLVWEFAQGEGDPQAPFFQNYLKVWWERSLLIQMGRAAGLDPGGPEDLPALRRAIRAHFAPELEFLAAMPEILVTPHYLFVHGGVDDEERLEEMDAWRCMKNDDFLSQNRTFRRWCVVGHWPVTLYRPHIPSAAPLLLEERHIASIDGGCSLKVDGQLNALELPMTPGGAFAWYAYDGLPTAVALDRQEPSADSVNVRWGRNVLEVLERGERLSLCRHLETGRELEVLNEYLYVRDGVTRCEDSTDYRLEIAPGDTVSVVRALPDRALVKKKGVTGWYFGRLDEKR
ncbi:metallophosphoesterase [uncultured Flavonifractor sp.]|uniref:metallophosphoesterase n=1 Tax=uncultured Flavonifractor sp. TaxID=1193534 RepID=UPI00260365CD|nr:metallophosphoesterase [uncultured Flavonifractor sp.]